MQLDFDFQNVEFVEFGVGKDIDQDAPFYRIAAAQEVQSALCEMAIATKEAAEATLETGNTPPKYEPSETHGSKEYVYLPLEDDLAGYLRSLHTAHLAMDNDALSDPSAVFCYFARMIDGDERRLTALRRATQFKGILKKRLIKVLDDSLQRVDSNLFQLDVDFDLLIDSHNIHILRPTGFEFTGRVQSAILGAVADNIVSVQEHMDFVDFSNVEDYAKRHPRAARYLASICSQRQMENIDRNLLQVLCEDTGVNLSEENGKITIAESNILDFLEVVDRRRYPIRLRQDSHESYRAQKRSKI